MRLTFDITMRPRRTVSYHRVQGGYSRVQYYTRYVDAVQRHRLHVRLVTRNAEVTKMEREHGVSTWSPQ